MSILATRAARHSSIRMDRPLTDSEIMSVAPSIYAEAPHTSRSDRYAYIPTIEILNGLRSQGFQPFMAAQAKVGRKSLAAGKQNYTRHLLRMRHPDTMKSADAAHEIILLNSHDGTSSYQMLSGAFRFVCMNGMVCGDVDEDIRIQHKGREILNNVIEGAYKVLSDTRRNNDVIEDMQSLIMKPAHRIAFANAAISLRFGEGNNVITSEQALEARRTEDAGNDQWSIFNRVQENTVQGGMMGRSANGRVRKVRGITGMDKDTHYNRVLWQLMQDMRAAA